MRCTAAAFEKGSPLLFASWNQFRASPFSPPFPSFSTHGCGLAAVIPGLFKKARLRLNEYSGQALSDLAMQDWADSIGATVLPRSRFSPQFAPRIVPLLTRTQQPAPVSIDARWMTEAAYPRYETALHPHFRSRVLKLMAGRVAR